MNTKFVIFSLLMLILITCSATVYAEDSLDNLTAQADVEVEAIAQDVDLESGDSEIIITDDTYDTYFNKYTGKMKDTVSPSVDTIKIGNISNKAFTIDRPLNIMPISSGCEISNGVIHLIQGSSGSNITNLVINNTKGELYLDGLFVSKMHGIWFSNSSDNLIFNNTIRIPGAEGCYAMPMGYSSRNRILYNDIVSTFTSCILMGLCDYNNISYNRLEVKTLYYAAVANIIYFNPYGHADYNGPADCVGTYISNNYIKNVPDNTPMEFTLNVMGKSDNTTIINNTIVNGFLGISVSGIANNIKISGNTIVNCTTSIITGANNVIISDNLVTGSSMDNGIVIFPNEEKYEENASVFNNTIIYDNLYNAISIGCGANVYNNTISLSRYGVGISDGSNNSNIAYNRIYVVADDGISLTGNNSHVSKNIIHTKANGISSIRKQEKYKAYNNTISSNRIYSDNYGVYIEGYVYNTTIKDNYIETNESEAFHIDMYTTLEDRNPGQIADNTINGIIKDTEILVIDDSNFYDYFGSDGYLKYDFKTGSQKILFLSFLTNKNLYFTDPITLTSNKQANLLYNITITLTEDASDSTIRDFKFYNFDKESIILDGVENVVIKGNEFTTLAGDNFESKTISVIRGCNFCNITDNSIFINSKSYYTYAISVSEPQSSLIKRFSSNFTIKNNNIIIMSCGVAEAMYFDSLVESEITDNSINIISDGSAYGIAVCDVIGRPHDILIKSNKIVANSKDMSYLVELYRADNCDIIDNYIKATSNGVYAIGVYNSSSVVNKNEIIVAGRNLTSLPPEDVLGKGNSAIYLARQSQLKEFMNNIIDSHDCEIITNDDSIVSKMKTNSYVISNYNYDLYFNSNNKIDSRTVKDNDIILFKDFTDPKTMSIDVLVTIKPYKHFNKFNATLVLLNGSDKSTVSGFNFNDAEIRLNGVLGILIHSNNFTDSRISDYGGVNNNISNNSFVVKADDFKAVIFNRCLNDTFEFNELNFNSSDSRFIVIEMSNQTGIFNNSFDCVGDSALISSSMSNLTDIFGNYITMNAIGNVYAYFADNSIGDNVFRNNILINSVSGRPVAIYYNNSHDNEIKFNRIVSSSDDGQDYAIVIDSQNNTVTNNYLVSSNGFKKGDDAVHAPNNTVHDNIPVTIYVSVNGTEDGNGSFKNPYPTIRKAVENCLSGAVICILPGMYNESGIVIDKNVTLTAINLEGNTYINALNSQLFNIKKNGILTVNALKIFNGFSVEGGALFNNLGTLMINNSVIYNSSSYYNNSNPTFKYKNKYDKYTMYSYDCSNLGLGGAILNRGELVINFSTLYDNFAHKGGAIADFGKTTIVNSLICNNTGVHGGAIYTNSKSEFTIENSEFMDNLAIQTLDYCSIKKIIYEEYPNLANLRYRYLSDCETLTGMGGAIFSNSILSIDNSLFDHNIAKYGGAIAYDSSILTNQNYYHESLDYDGRAGKLLEFSPNSILNIKNSYFKNNEAKNTSCGNLSMLVDDPYGGNVYGIHAEGGAIFGAIHDFNLFNSSFTNNLAESNGGALCVQSLNSSIEQCVFNDNTAGESGGALDLFGNVNVFNTKITNNSAKYGGAVQYSSFDSYGRIQYNAGMFNLTVSGNRALEYGGAFAIGQANFAIKNSNIYDNTAPRGSTFSGTYGVTSGGKIDARSNWWGSTDGPDDSVFMQNNIRFRTWAGQKIDWTPIKINTGGDGNSQGNGNRGNGQSQPGSSVSTGSGTHTGSTLTIDTSSSHGIGSNGFNFNGNWPSGNNNGNWGGNFGDGEGVSPYESSGNSRTSVNGNAVNPNSLSKSNSSSVNNLASVGMTANAADSSPSAQSSTSEGGSSEGGKAYEITKEVKKEIIDKDLSIFNVLFILLWIFLFIGFYRKYRAENN